MTEITSSAPGNLMIMGEHAILYGQKCISCAVDRRITVTINELAKDDIIVQSDIRDVGFSLSLSVLRQSSIHDFPPEYQFVLAAIKLCDLEQGVKLSIRSDFPPELGLGSSAAVTAATVGGLEKLKDNSFDITTSKNRHHVLERSFDVVQEVQNKRGSGYDLATSIWGGVIKYDKNSKSVERFPVDDMPLTIIYSGSKFKTTRVLEIVDQLSHDLEDEYQQIYSLIGRLVDRASDRIMSKNWAGLGRLFNMNQGLLDAIGVNNQTLSKIIYWARDQGAYGSKISGAGLGDCAIALGRIPDHYPKNEDGIRCLDITMAQRGLAID
jgi:mevalonate kinase